MIKHKLQYSIPFTKKKKKHLNITAEKSNPNISFNKLCTKSRNMYLKKCNKTRNVYSKKVNGQF